MAESNAGPEGDLGNDAQGPNGPPNDPHGGGASGSDGEEAPVQLYRFKVRTADGREMTSAVAVVDPNAEGEGQDDPKDALDELDKKHKAEGKKHHEDLKGAGIALG